MATTSWTEQTESSWTDWEQNTTGWMFKCPVNSRLARRIAVLVTQPQWLASTCSKAAHSSQHLLQGCPLHGVVRRAIWPTDTSLRDKRFGDPQALRRTAAFVQMTGVSIYCSKKKTHCMFKRNKSIANSGVLDLKSPDLKQNNAKICNRDVSNKENRTNCCVTRSFWHSGIQIFTARGPTNSCFKCVFVPNDAEGTKQLT